MENNSQNLNEQTTKSALEKFAFSEVELKETATDLNLQKDKRRAREVCICGHSYSRHRKSVSGISYCKPNARRCHCDKFRPVITTTNLNPFIRFSRGNGPLHALSQGIASLMEKGGSFDWIEGAAVCSACGTDNSLIPVIITKTGLSAEPDKDKITDRMDILLCHDCNFNLQKNGRLS